MVNVSAATHEVIKDDFECKHRGKIHAKNVGEIDMYFVTKERVKSTKQEPNVKMPDILYG